MPSSAVHMPLAYFILYILASISAFSSVQCMRSFYSPEVHVSSPVHCPCFVHVYRQHASVNSNAVATDRSFDLLVVLKKQWQRASKSSRRIGSVEFVHEHSLINVSSSSFVHDDGLLQHFEDHKVEQSGEVVVVLRGSRSTFDVSDYILRIQPISVRSTTCPVVLKPHRPRKASRMDVFSELETYRGVLENTPARKNEITPHIIGGDIASRKLRPYMVTVYNPSLRYCSGVLISRFWALTAAHCLVNTSFTASVGLAQAYGGGVETKIVRAFTNPSYARGGAARQNDITVFEMADPAPSGSKFMPIDTALPEVGEFVRVAGYGTISFEGDVPDPSPAALRQVDVPVTAPNACRRAYRATNVLSKTKQICAGYFDEGGCDACLGDSGGPLFRYDASDRPVLLGLSSYGLRCALPSFPGVYVRVAAFLEFLGSTPAIFTVVSQPASPTPAAASSLSPIKSLPPSPSPSASRAAKSRLKCKPGTELRGDVCKSCENDSVSNGKKPCRQCANGFVRDSKKGSKCSCSGKFARGLGIQDGNCAPCPAGTFSGTKDKDCKQCPVNTASKRGQSSCQKCPPGTVAPPGSKKCKPCKGDECPKGSS